MAPSIPRWAKLKPSDIEQIQKALKKAESKTSGELVPMIVRRSTPVSLFPHVLFCWFLILWLLLSPVHWQQSFWSWTLPVLGGLALSILLSRLFFIQRWLARLLYKEDFVTTRARLEFYEFNVGHTAGATGILIMASMMEHQVVVLADSGISEKLPADTWQQVCDVLVDHMKRGQVAEGFLRAINLCGDLLETHFPKPEADLNELSDHFIIKD